MNSETNTQHSMHPCPACGYYMFSALNEQSEICQICGWHNDLVDLQEMYRPVGPNHVSLEDAQKNFVQIGATEPRFVNEEKFIKHPFVRKPTAEDVRDPKWRPLDRNKDKPREIGDPFGKKLEELYYWYWN